MGAEERRQAKAALAAEKARTKALRPWFKKMRFIIPLGLVAVIVVASLASGGDDSTDKVTQSGSVEEGDDAKLFPGRPDAQGEDQERNVGDGVELSGYTATVTTASFQQSLSDFEDDGYVVVEVNILNRDDRSQPYNPFDWKLQTPNGQVLNPTITSVEMLHAGDLISGGTVSGKVIFEAGTQKGDFYIIYKPDAFDAARGIWKLSV